MNEVSTQTVALLADALELRGLEPAVVWRDLGLTCAELRPGGRIGWETWVAMIERVEQLFGPSQLERLFVPGAGARTGHGFVRLATAIVSLRDLFALFARWGLRRSLMVVTARFELTGETDARFTVSIDPERLGSLPTLRFISGVLCSLPTLQDLPPARVRIAPDATAHRASYLLELPRDGSRLARARRLLRLAGGASAALDELEQQAAEIAAKNAALEEQLAETRRAHAALAERDEWLRFADRLIAAGTLAAGVAHEINNPLGYAVGNLELVRLRLQQTPGVGPEVDEMLGEVGDGLERIRAVVTDLRAFARPEEDTLVRTEPERAASAGLRVVSSLVRHRATLSTEFAADTPAVIANPSRLGQVVINLVLNACDAMPERPPADNRVLVRTRRLPTGEAAIEVVDNGAGIAPDLVPRLFDPFFTTKPTGVGTGLGLSVCQRIVASLQGRIDVTSTPGQGSTFSIVLPPAPPEDEDGAAAAQEPSAPAEPAAEPAAELRRRVLLIDDEPVLRRMLHTMLAMEGYEVVEAGGGREGLAAVDGADFDAIICDLMMPDLDGVDVHAELARRRPELLPRIVFVSGGAVSARARAFADRPDIAMLTKPFSLAQLVDALAALAPPSGRP